MTSPEFHREIRSRASSGTVADTSFVSFDGGVRVRAGLQRPDRYRFWTSGLGIDGLTRIPRGAGLSYAASSFGDAVISIEHGAFNRILDHDSGAHVVQVEAGITLGALHNFLVKRGEYLPIQPGHGAITVGGCIAADVHGKNQARDGTFINQVVSLSLFHPDHGFMELSRAQHPSLFDLTCGGYGLTGHIISARLKTTPIPAHRVVVRAVPVADAIGGVAALAKVVAESDFAYSWHDFMRGGKSFGKGFVFNAYFEAGDASGSTRAGIVPKLSGSARGRFPVALLNRWTTVPFNRLYALRTKMGAAQRSLPLSEALFPAHAAQAYFGLFGHAGFHEYQALIPRGNANCYLEEIRAYLASHRVPITLASGKWFSGTRQLLRFNGDGLCLALNVPRTNGAEQLLRFLDTLMPKLGGIPNIIKDSRLPRGVVDSCYAGADEFRMRLRAFDPKRRFQSELSRRLDL